MCENAIISYSRVITCCGYSNEPSHLDGSFEYPQPMFNVLVEKYAHSNEYLITHSCLEACFGYCKEV